MIYTIVAECDDFTIVGCGACTAANEGKTCKWCSQADGIDQCVDRTTKCPHDMEPSLNEEECDARAVREEEAVFQIIFLLFCKFISKFF